MLQRYFGIGFVFSVACEGASDSMVLDTAVSEGVHCEEDVCTLSGVITEDLTLTSDYSWILRGGVFIGNDVDETVLTIEPGTTIYGESTTDGMLVIRRGSRLEATGTVNAPIVFTSSKAAGSRARGDWGGLILNGRAPINTCAGVETPLCEAYGEGGTGWYGGDNPEDSSGTLRYVRVEFAGTLISPDNELNGIAFQGVGRGTTVDYVQVHQNADDGIEFFGGTVEFRHLLVTGVGDDLLDWTDGWVGKGQFFIGQQYDDAGDNGIEADNNAEANDATPMSSPMLSNITLIGAPESENSDMGMLLREGTGGELSNLVVIGFQEACLDIDHEVTFDHWSEGTLSITQSTLSCVVPFMEDEGEDPIADAFLAGLGNESHSVQLEDPFNHQAPDFRPKMSETILNSGQTPLDAFFTEVGFRGAIATEDWTSGWTTYVVN